LSIPGRSSGVAANFISYAALQRRGNKGVLIIEIDPSAQVEDANRKNNRVNCVPETSPSIDPRY
jgi:hypothetical protein